MAAAVVERAAHLVLLVCFPVEEDYGDPIIGAQRREMLTVFYDMLLVVAAMIVWLVISAALVEQGP